jgi:hypothetical protein
MDKRASTDLDCATCRALLALRKQYPRWGKNKLVVLLRSEKCIVSTSLVGRILADLERRGALHEPPRPAVLRRERRKLRNRPWAVRKPEYWRIQQPGDLVEIDTKELRLRRGVVLKHFSARDVVSRWDVVEVHGRATSLAAAQVARTKCLRRTLPSHTQRRVLPSADGLRRAASPQSTTTPLGTHLQPGQAPSVLGLPHPDRISTPMETIPRKGKASLIYWTSTVC